MLEFKILASSRLGFRGQIERTWKIQRLRGEYLGIL